MIAYIFVHCFVLRKKITFPGKCDRGDSTTFFKQEEFILTKYIVSPDIKVCLPVDKYFFDNIIVAHLGK